jgi:hypothetical protein
MKANRDEREEGKIDTYLKEVPEMQKEQNERER